MIRSDAIRRGLARALAALVLLAGLGAAPAARAQVVRSFAPRYTVAANGDLTLIANTLMTCSGGGCGSAQGASGNRTNNDDFAMVHVDADADPATFNSSQATLALPAGANVLWAGLYWGGSSASAARNACLFATPGGGYTAVTAGQLDALGNAYSAFAEVTSRVRLAGNGAYQVGNVQSDTGVGGWAGWSLVVVYELASEPPRFLTVRDGFAQVSSATAPISIPMSGFVTPSNGQVRRIIGAVVYDGDNGTNGDRFTLNGVNQGDGVNSASNPFNSTVALLGNHFTAKNPNWENQLGFDADLIRVTGILPGGSTSQTLGFASSGDSYFPAAILFAIDMYAPVLEGSGFVKSVVDVDGAPARPGDLLEYTVVLRNTGNDAATQAVVRDTLAANLAYVAGSLSIVDGPNAGTKSDAAGDDQAEYDAASRSIVARLGTGATAAAGGTIAAGVQTTVRFRARIVQPTPNGTVVANQAVASFLGAQFGTAFSTRSDGDLVASGAQPTTVAVVATIPSGTVFEDVNYGGGAGRSLAASAGAGRPGARVELYTSAGAFVAATTTDATGHWAFDGWAPGDYAVRVVSTTVTSSRPGAVATLVPVQTWKTDAPAGTAVGDPDRVGGEDPARPDAAANTTSFALAALTTAAATPHSIGRFTLGAANVGGLDFGYNFDVITNLNAAGQGSLRQFIVNANTLGNTGLAQAGQAAGVEASLFMIPGAAARPGLRAGLTNRLAGGVARFPVASLLPAITGAATSLDGTTQTANGGDTNPGTLGTVGTVGVDGLALAGVAAPEVEIVDAGGLAIGLDVQAANCVVRGVAILGFGNSANAGGHADVRVEAAASGARIEACVLGAPATAFADPGAAARTGGTHVRVNGAAAGTLTGSLLGFAAGPGVALTAGASGWTIQGNEIRDNALGNPTLEGVSVQSAGPATVRGNRIATNDGPGVDMSTATGAVTLENNTIEGNGIGASATAETPGVRAGGAGHRVDRNVIAGNDGAGVVVLATGSATTITRNSIFGNGTVTNRAGEPATGQVGIDLLRATDSATKGTAPFVTRNDAGDGDTGGNGLLNFPVLETALASGGTLTLTGWARPGATIELYLTDSDASGFGEGRTWAATVVEGSGADLDATASAYAPGVNGLDQGGDMTNRFRFVIALPPGVVAGRALCATATLAAATSEFSGRVVVGGGVPVTGFVYLDADHDATMDGGEAGVGLATWIKLVTAAAPGTAQQVAAADATTGAYAFASVPEGDFTLVLDDNATVADVTPTYPAGRIGTEAAPGTRPATVPGIGGLSGQNFGVWHGGRVDGRVFRDDGAGAPGGAGANDGVQQAGEPGVAGVPLELRAGPCAGGVCDSTTSDGAGDWRLWLPGGAAGAAATVQAANPAGWVSVSGAAGATGGVYDRASDRVLFTGVAGAIQAGVRFGDVPPNGFGAGGAGTVAPGGVALYPHVFTARSAGAVAFGATRAASPAIAGWGLELVRDLDCDGVIDAGEAPVAGALSLVAGERVCLVARHASPAGAPAGASETATLTATFVYAGAAPALSAAGTLTDVTTVSNAGSGLVLTKAVDRTTARPGELLTYTITYTNLSNAPLTAIEVADATPAYTVFEDAACGTAGAGLSACGVSAQPAAGATGAVRWTLTGALLPGASGSVTYRVRVQ